MQAVKLVGKNLFEPARGGTTPRGRERSRGSLMSSESPPAIKPKPRASARPLGGDPPRPSIGLRLLDGTLLAAFLALTFLLGMFPLKDTDFWWHLRTGDLILQTGGVPSSDTYTFTVSGKPWIDLHWLFQVAVSLVYARGGVPALTLAKCAVTTLAVLLLVTARRREWPFWAMLTAWLPALLVLGGRMYVRPETLSLLYLSMYLAVLMRIDRLPALAFLLPLVQVAWVNTQGLFVFGPVLLATALFDAALRPGAFAVSRRRWWRMVVAATVFTGLACLVNPYGLTGALYPLQLARTMANPVFSSSIAELTPVPLFIKRDGLLSLPLRLQLVTMAIGGLSFLAPIVWLVVTRLRALPAGTPAKAEKTKGKLDKPSKKPAKPARAATPSPAWRLSPFRLVLFVAFCALSWQATRNSHQFAAVVGTVTAWNLGEWAGAIRRRSWEIRGWDAVRPGAGLLPRLAALAAIGGVFLWVATGRFYESSREGRTIGLGEQPLWFPHDAVKFSGGPGMPERFLGYHIGHASLYEYYFGPERKVFADARLEVIGPDLYERYMALQRRITANDPGWSRELDEMGRPVVLADLEDNAAIGAGLLTRSDWRCVWFDPIAVVFVHASYRNVVESNAVDFAARHFHPDPSFQPSGTAALLASAKGLRNLAALVARSGPDRARPLVLLGMDQARRLGQAVPDGPDAWKLLGQFETLREALPAEPVARFRLPFDPVFDLSAVHATFALRKAVDTAPDDFLALLLLSTLYESREMNEARLPLLDRLVNLTPINGMQAEQQSQIDAIRTGLRSRLGPPPPATWENLSQLGQIVNGLLAEGRAATAADYLERAAPAESRSWEETDRIATLRLHLGEPAKARSLWRLATAPTRPAIRQARIAVTYLVEGSFDLAREGFQSAIAADPSLFEAHYGLAVLEQDTGRAGESLTAARKAVALAPTVVARNAAQEIVATVTPYASSPIADR
jgi:tetratricopeptide (TPR) repeat protein